jgi:hypothetical protein
MDTKYNLHRWPGVTHAYMDIDWLLPQRPLTKEDLRFPAGYFINPDETDENSVTGPQKEKILELFEELNTPSMTQEMVQSFRNIRARPHWQEFS